jgi:A/G-specific adenine glycosylase
LSSTPKSEAFADRLLRWFDHHGRRDLPWQGQPDSYRIWISEIMLQQTQVSTVLAYFERFMQRFPDLPTLAAADLDQVMAEWEGLGYYSRARNLHSTAKLCVEQYRGTLPDDLDQLCALPGIGRSTACAILSLTFDRPLAILDGNVKRVLARQHAVSGWPGRSAVSRKLWQLAESHLPSSRGADYTQAIMDLGALLCLPRAPDCPACPVSDSCRALTLGKQLQYPEAKPRVATPERHCVLLLIEDSQQRLLMHRRPAPGIWGGLWSVPMFDSLELAEASIGELADKRHGEPFRHAFTHFRLLAEPILCQKYIPGSVIRDDSEHQWFSSEQTSTLGMPKPIRILVSEYFSGQIQWQEPCTA